MWYLHNLLDLRLPFFFFFFRRTSQRVNELHHSFVNQVELKATFSRIPFSLLFQVRVDTEVTDGFQSIVLQHCAPSSSSQFLALITNSGPRLPVDSWLPHRWQLEKQQLPRGSPANPPSPFQLSSRTCLASQIFPASSNFPIHVRASGG